MAEEDIIFGKNRHFYGGIEPSNIVSFTANPYGDHVRLSITLPQDTSINGQTLCVVTGVVIRKSLTGYPKDEFDGDLLVDLPVGSNRTIMYTDADTDVTGTYFYAAFPYSAQGVYNRSYLNRYAYNEPADMVTFTAKSAYEYETDTYGINLIATLPENIVGAVIRKSAVTYPTSETDGEEFMTITESGTYKDTDVTADTMYFYSAFPYTSTGAYNRSSVNRASVTAAKYTWLYGYDLDIADSDPDTRVSYPVDVDNTDYSSAYMDFSSSAFKYDDWSLAPGEEFMPKPCMLKNDGTVDYYLDPNDYSKREDGVTASDVSTLTYEGNAMMEWPKIYTKREEVDGVYKFRCSDTKLGDDWDCWCNYDKNDKVIDHFYTAIYPGYISNSLLRSISARDSSGGLNPATTNHIALATGIGDGWHTEVYADLLLIQDLLVLMGKSTDVQTVFGMGNIGGNNYVKSGTLDTNGMFYGTSDVTSAVKVFGMENLWGNMFHGVSGLCAKIYTNTAGTKLLDILYKITRGSHDGTSGDYNSSGDGYLSSWAGEQLTVWPPCASNSAALQEWAFAVLKTSDYGRVVGYAGVNTRIEGSTSTYECDSADIYGDSVGVHPALFGGYNSYNYNCGIFSVYFCSSAWAYCNIRISCKPTLKEA